LGTGETTLFNSMLSPIQPDSEKMAFKVEDVTKLEPLALSSSGVWRTLQTLQMFGNLMTEKDVKSALGIPDHSVALQSGRCVLHRKACELLVELNIERSFLGSLFEPNIHAFL
jgi:ABC-type branched-subunit amino acid transport system ATPase component